MKIQERVGTTEVWKDVISRINEVTLQKEGETKKMVFKYTNQKGEESEIWGLAWMVKAAVAIGMNDKKSAEQILNL